MCDWDNKIVEFDDKYNHHHASCYACVNEVNELPLKRLAVIICDMINIIYIHVALLFLFETVQTILDF